MEKKKKINTQETPHKAEFYFIQLCFTRNIDLLMQKQRKIYDALLTRYKKLWDRIVSKGINDVMVINDCFTGDFGNFIAEGLVIKPEHELRDRRGNRIITKIKVKDFKE